MIKLKKENGNFIYINANRICSVDRFENKTRIVFGYTHILDVVDPIDRVLKKIEIVISGGVR